MAGISHSPGGAFKAQTETFFVFLHAEVAGSEPAHWHSRSDVFINALHGMLVRLSLVMLKCLFSCLASGHCASQQVGTIRSNFFFKSAVTRVLHKGFEPFKHCTLLLTKHRLVWPLQCLPLPLQGVFAGPEPQHLLQQHAECEQVRQHQKLMSTKKIFVKHVVFCGAARHSKQF